ncbi:MAG: glutamyl-tRNA reductase [Acidimicrobiales bacterium]
MVTIGFGLNHRNVPLDVLEAVAVSPESRAKLAADLLQPGLVRGAVVLATCHRLELYVDAERFHESFRVVRDALATHTGADPLLLADRLIPYFDAEAAEHLFSVAAGLDSAVLGEHEILGQVRTSLEIAQAAGCMSPPLNLLFRRAIEVGKRVRTDTALGRGTASISHASVVLAGELLGGLAGTRLVVLGAGEMGSGVATSAVAHGATDVVVANRSRDRAEALVERIGGTQAARAVTMDELDDVLVHADVLVCSTGSSRPVLTAEHLAEVVARRARSGAGSRDLVVVDVAMPRDVDPAARHLAGLQLIDLEDIRAHTDKGLHQRRAAVAEATALVQTALERFEAEVSGRTADPVVAALRQRGEELRQAEWDRVGPRLERLSERERQAVEAMSKALLAKLLHQPTMALKTSAGTTHGSRLAQSVSELFDLDC